MFFIDRSICWHLAKGRLSYLKYYRHSFYTEDYCVLRLSMVWVQSCILIRTINDVKLLVFLVCSGNPFHAWMPLGKKENLFEFVLAYRTRKVFLSLCLSKYCIRLLLCCISKLEFKALCIITNLLLVLLSSGVTLVSCEYSQVMNLAALF